VSYSNTNGRWLAISMLLIFCSFCAQAQKSRPVSSGDRAINGVVLSSTSGQPLGGADVTLTDTRTATLVAETATDAEGHFAFSHLQDGKYALRANHRGFIASAYDEHDGFSTAIVVGEGLTSTGLKFAIKPLAVIYGTISDDSGDPVQQGRVQLYRQDERSGTGRVVRAGGTVSDDLGNYEFPRLSPGNYYIAVTAIPWYATRPQSPAQSGDGAQESSHSPLDVAYSTTFYADTSDSESATPIPVKAGDRIPVNFAMHPVPAVHITMQVPSVGRGQFPAMPQMRQDVFGSMETVGLQSVTYSSHGDGSNDQGTNTVELSGIAPGHYEMELHSPRGEAEHYTTVDASAGNSVIDVSGGETLAQISGKVAMAGGGPLPRGLSLSLTPQQGSETGRARTERDGSFEIQGIYPGVYELVANAAETAVAVTEIKATGATVDGRLLKVAAAPVTVTATLAEGAATVTGFVNKNGRPASGIMVVLVPANTDTSHDLFRRDQTDSDGSFTLKSVVPGSYTAVAIEDGWNLDWARSEVIGHYLPKGLKVTVPAHTKDIPLSGKLEAQPK
jgi:protocatechuate 3,4-dioxygenase beta subunit